MAASQCPHCNMLLTSGESRGSACPSCGGALSGPVSPSAKPLTDTGSIPIQPAAAKSDAGGGVMLLVFGMTALLLVSFVLPFGAMPSLVLCWKKGDSVCAKAFCEKPSEEKREYSGDHSIGYCAEHVGEAPESYSSKADFMPFCFAFFLLWFLGAYAMGVKEVLQADANTLPDKRSYLVKLWAGGIIGLNLVFWVGCRWLVAGA